MKKDKKAAAEMPAAHNILPRLAVLHPLNPLDPETHALDYVTILKIRTLREAGREGEAFALLETAKQEMKGEKALLLFAGRRGEAGEAPIAILIYLIGRQVCPINSAS